MILNVGDVIEIRNKQATICFEAPYKENRYICVAFSNDNIQYDIYKYKEENQKLLVAKVIDKQELEEVTKLFIKEEVEKSGIPQEIEPILDYLEKQNES